MLKQYEIGLYNIVSRYDFVSKTGCGIATCYILLYFITNISQHNIM